VVKKTLQKERQDEETNGTGIEKSCHRKYTLA